MVFGLIGHLVALITFPGIMVHELGHKFFCDYFNVKVHDVCYIRMKNPMGYVIHDVPDKFHKTFFIDVGPFIVNTLFTIFFAVLAGLFQNVSVLPMVLTWLGISIGAHAFPSSHDSKVLWKESKRHLKDDWFALIGFPFSALFRIANVLSFFWFDFIYGGIVFSLTLTLVTGLAF